MNHVLPLAGDPITIITILFFFSIFFLKFSIFSSKSLDFEKKQETAFKVFEWIHHLSFLQSSQSVNIISGVLN